jgi:uncharacterized protein YaiI (UPF0178 family)
VTLLIDADSINVRLREIIVTAAERRGFPVVFAANRPIPYPETSAARMDVVPDADDRLVEICEDGDLAVTRDVPLAARLIEKGAVVLNDRGDRWDSGNIAERLSERDAAAEMREAGILPQRGRQFGKREIFGFSNALDRELTRRGFVPAVDKDD